MENNPDVIQFISILHQFIRLETHTLVYIRMTHRKLKVTPPPFLYLMLKLEEVRDSCNCKTEIWGEGTK